MCPPAVEQPARLHPEGFRSRREAIGGRPDYGTVAARAGGSNREPEDLNPLHAHKLPQCAARESNPEPTD